VRGIVPIFMLALALACKAPPPGQGDDSTSTGGSDSDSESGVDTPPPDVPHCDPAACMQACQLEDDECGETLVGSCSEADVCVCESNSGCQPCLQANCSPYESCGDVHSIGGECVVDCYHELEYDWDPEVGCVLVLPADLPPLRSYFLEHWFVIIGSDRNAPPLLRAETCVDLEGWVLDERAMTVTLCPNACPLFEAEGSLLTGWAVSCE
jgi:hypothetical protein